MTPQEQHRLNCPALDKTTGKCHGKSYFLGKPGSAIKAKQCDQKCRYMINFNKGK